MSSNVLSARDTNTHMKAAASPDKKGDKAKSLEDHRQELQSRLRQTDKTQPYVSPSDSIQSPATQKLKDFRNKHMTKKANPAKPSLFQSMSSRNHKAANDGALFPDIPMNANDAAADDAAANDAGIDDEHKDGQA